MTTTTKEQLQLTSPLEVLLSLIEKEHLEISEVSLSSIAGKYLSFLKKLDNVPASTLADFLTVASRLVLLKSRTLTALPDDEDIEEPLLEQLRLYQEFRRAAAAFRMLAEKNGSAYSHAMRWDEFTTFSMPPELTSKMLEETITQILQDITTWDILPEESIHDRVSIGEKIEELRVRLQKQAQFALHEIAAGKGDTLHTLVGFLAILEMVRQKEVRATQTSLGGTIMVERNTS